MNLNLRIDLARFSGGERSGSCRTGIRLSECAPRSGRAESVLSNNLRATFNSDTCRGGCANRLRIRCAPETDALQIVYLVSKDLLYRLGR
jgi:hypothetical protein